MSKSWSFPDDGSPEPWSAEWCKRRMDAETRIFQHGYIPLGFVPGVTLEQLERFADELDAKVEMPPEKVY